MYHIHDFVPAMEDHNSEAGAHPSYAECITGANVVGLKDMLH